MPDLCPAGHPLRYPNVEVSWVPCDCDRASEHMPRGHQNVRCDPCGREIRQGGCDNLVNGRCA